MQHALPAQFETLWDIADRVAAEGQQDFRCKGEDFRSVASLCGLTVYYANRQPTRLLAADLDVTVGNLSEGQNGADNIAKLRAMAQAGNFLNFRKGTMGELRAWQVRLAQFSDAARPAPRRTQAA